MHPILVAAFAFAAIVLPLPFHVGRVLSDPPRHSQQAPVSPAGFGARDRIAGTEPARLTWAAVPGAEQYQIHVRVKASGRVIVTQEWLIVPYWQMPTAMPAQQYEYQVRACTTIAATSPCGPWSAWVPFER